MGIENILNLPALEMISPWKIFFKNVFLLVFDTLSRRKWINYFTCFTYWFSNITYVYVRKTFLIEKFEVKNGIY